MGIQPVGPLCENGSDVVLTGTPAGGIWSGKGITDSQAGIFSPSSVGVGTYTITYSVSGECGGTTSIELTVNPAPEAGVSVTEDELMLGSSTVLSVTGGTTYQWTPEDGLSCSTCATTRATPMSTTNYCVEVTDNNGCSDTACVTVKVRDDCGELFVPNAFSPNGDGVNDVLYVRGGCIKEMHFIIYDRWGHMVFESTDQNVGWDGTYKGKPLQDAVFVYYLKVLYYDGRTEEMKGNVALMR